MLFRSDTEDQDIDWLLSVAQQADCVIIDIDNCDPITQKFITYLLTEPNVHYITNDELTPYKLINQNRIFNLDWIIEQILDEGTDDVQED